MKWYKSRWLWFGAVMPAVLALLLYLGRGWNFLAESVFGQGVTRVLTWTLTRISNLLPFSLAELLIFLIPVGILVFLIRTAVHSTLRNWARFGKIIFSAAAWGIAAFLFLFVIQFGRTDMKTRLEYRTENIRAEELYQAAVLMREEAGDLSAEIVYNEDGYSVWQEGMSLEESNRAILDYAYRKRDFTRVKEKLGLPIWTDPVRPKPIIGSEPFSYTGILGVYIPFTGEANINMAAPPFIVASTTAHEQSHQKGFSREDEANYLSVVICLLDDAPYMRYSGALYAFRHLSGALYRADRDLYNQLMTDTPETLKKELRWYDRWISAHENHVTETVTRVNDSYLKASGGGGTISYSEVVKLLIGQYRKENPEA